MSVKRLRKLACEAYNLLPDSRCFAGFVRACQVFGIEVFPGPGGAGVIIRTEKFWLERVRNKDGLVILSVLPR